MKFFRFSKSFITIAVLLVLISGCMHKEIVKVDLDTYLKNQQQYQGEQFKDKELVITTTLKDVNQRYDLYRGKIIELSAPVTYYGKSLFWSGQCRLDSVAGTLLF